MNKVMNKLKLLIVIALIIFIGLVSDARAYIDPGTAGGIVGGISAGIGMIFAFFGSVAVAILVKVKKLWHWNLFGKLLIVMAVVIIIALVVMVVSLFV